MVAEQLRVESETRKRVESFVAKAARAILFLQALVNTRVDELTEYFADLVSLLLTGAVKQGGALLGSRAADAYLVRRAPFAD